MRTFRIYNDVISSGASVLCILHCIALPLLAGSINSAWLTESGYEELAIMAISVLFGGIAMWKGYTRHHQRKIIPVLFVTGILVSFLSGLAEQEAIEVLMKVTGGGVLITAHINNCRHCKSCERREVV